MKVYFGITQSAKNVYGKRDFLLRKAFSTDIVRSRYGCDIVKEGMGLCDSRDVDDYGFEREECLGKPNTIFPNIIYTGKTAKLENFDDLELENKYLANKIYGFVCAAQYDSYRHCFNGETEDFVLEPWYYELYEPDSVDANRRLLYDCKIKLYNSMKNYSDAYGLGEDPDDMYGIAPGMRMMPDNYLKYEDVNGAMVMGINELPITEYGYYYTQDDKFDLGM